MMETTILSHPIAVALLGAAMQELLYWYEIRARLHIAQTAKLLRSPAYWLITILMILVCGIATHFWYLPDAQPLRTYLLTGAALPLLLKQGVKVLTPDKQRLGENSPLSYGAAIGKYFFMR